MTDAFGRELRRLMAQHPRGPLSVAELARLTHMPRSTIYRHLGGLTPNRSSLLAYATALGADAAELARLAGYPWPADQGHQAEVEALAQALEGLDTDALEIIWRLVDLLSQSHRHAPVSDGIGQV